MGPQQRRRQQHGTSLVATTVPSHTRTSTLMRCPRDCPPTTNIWFPNRSPRPPMYTSRTSRPSPSTPSTTRSTPPSTPSTASQSTVHQQQNTVHLQQSTVLHRQSTVLQRRSTAHLRRRSTVDTGEDDDLCHLRDAFVLGLVIMVDESVIF